MPTHRTRTSALLQARIPRDLVVQAEQLAARLGCTVSDLLREGLALRLASDSTPDILPDTSTMELSDAVRRYIDQQIDQRIDLVVRERLSGVGHVPPGMDPLPGRRARQAIPAPDTVSGAAYDATRFYLAPLCKRAHNWQGTGQSLLRRGNGNCVVCQRELRRARDAQKQAG